MAYIPQFVKNTDLSAETLNAIGTDIGVGVTVVQDDLETLHSYAKVVLGASVMQNQFLSALVNRIAKAEYTSRAFRNPLARLKKGILEFGEAIEEIYVEIANGVKRNEDLSNPSYPFDTAIPDVKTAFHLSNLRAKYPVTVRNVDLRKAFLNFSGVDDLVARIVESVYSAHNYDEYLLTKYKVAKKAISIVKAGKDVNLGLDTPTYEEEAKAILRTTRKFAKLLPIIKTEYNEAGVHTHTPVDNLVCFLTAEASANVDVDALAGAFNMSKADFIGRIVDVDNFSFTTDEKNRIQAITDITDEDWFSDVDIAILAKVPCVLADDQMLQIYDTVEPRFTEQYNGSDDYWNYWLHVDQVFSTSPFVNCVVIDNNEVADVTTTLTGCTKVSGGSTAAVGTAYKASFAKASGYTFTGATYSVTMNGVDVTSTAIVNPGPNVLTVNIAEVTGDIAITITAAEA